MKKFVSLSILTAFLFLLSACSNTEFDIFANIHGLVVDASDGTPVSGATVVLSPGGNTHYSESDGSFAFEELDPHQYTITVQKDGYSTNRISVTTGAGENVQITIPLNKL